MKFLKTGTLCISVLPAVALAAEATGSIDADQITFVQEHSGLVVTIFALAMCIIGFFLHRTLKQNDEQHSDFKDEIKKIWEAYGINDRLLTQVHTEHEILKQQHCRADDPPGMVRTHSRKENGVVEDPSGERED